MYRNKLPTLDHQQKTVSTTSPFGSDISSRPARSVSLQTAWLAAALTAGFALPADAQVYWPMDPGAAYYGEPQRHFEPRRPRIARTKQKLPDAPKDTAKPVGPIVVAISIDRQTLKLYDQNGLFAESPVSTGMRGHSTPMGVFSVIQKNKYHRSNIYSGAPMPYMQRITWSGVAMHAGVLPGYPASHGCIRMPMNFAMRMWGWTRMGARVIITPGEISPADFSHPLLATRKPSTKPLAATTEPEKHAETTPKSDRSSIVDAASHDKLQLRLTSIAEDAPIRTADASGALPQKSDADSVVAQAWDASRGGGSWDAGRGGVTPEPEAAKDGPKENAKTPSPNAQKDCAVAKDDAAKSADGDAGASDDKAAGDKSPDAKPADKKSEAPKTDKDQTRVTDSAAPTPVAVAVAPEGSAEFIGPVKPRTGHVAAFVSAKENKIYVRQNFEPWFEAPVTIAAPDRPLGTHVFTVRADKDDAEALRWSVVSLPAPIRAAEETPRRRRGEPVAPAAAPAQPSSPTEALDRLTIPKETMTRIASALAPGGSITVSDRGLGDETGRGTDFIVPLR
ncbi:MAG: L,D-transpeptidase family protein [Afipia sp.]|nr:L,D-transpeptidase family protein [Afipia sp.]WIG51187.1 MAG: L,D-transpeptidase [Afipia sp.]